MSENSSIKDTLYSKINAIGQETIHKLLLEKKYSELFAREKYDGWDCEGNQIQ